MKNNTSGFQSGKRDGYIYGYVFRSGLDLVLDSGDKEYPVEKPELLINGEFVLKENITLEFLRSIGLYGCEGRIKDDFSS